VILEGETMRSEWVAVILALLAQAPAQAQGVPPADLAGDWILSYRLYDETEYQRLTAEAAGDRLSVRAWGFTLEGGLRDGKLELQRSGNDGPPVTMTGTARRDGMSGAFSIGPLDGTWDATRIPARPPGAPRDHQFEPTTFHRVFSGAISPVLHIYPGDTVRTWTVDAGGSDAQGVRRSLGGNPQTGPFYVEGALPGDTLVVKLRRIRLNRDTAFSSGSLAAHAITPGYVADRKPVTGYDSNWALDRVNGVARLARPTEALKDYTVPLAPMLGCVGVAPPGRMAFRTGYPGSFGGNMDYNRLREGVTLYLPVYQPGALLFLGDGHAAQGDGELTGNALETSMDIEFAVDVITRKSLAMPRAEDDESLMAMGIARSLTEGLQVATTEMARWLEEAYALNASEVASVLGTALRYDIAEVVDPYVNVVARVPRTALARIRRPGP
jgi:acetamidase/formamidase